VRSGRKKKTKIGQKEFKRKKKIEKGGKKKTFELGGPE
jgi:hypothetical protein